METFKGFSQIVSSQPWIYTNNNSKQNKDDSEQSDLHVAIWWEVMETSFMKTEI